MKYHFPFYVIFVASAAKVLIKRNDYIDFTQYTLTLVIISAFLNEYNLLCFKILIPLKASGFESH